MYNEYDRLAGDYHWLVEDDLLSGEFFLTRHRSLLDSLSPDARILDCACGIGSDAIGLARCGYQVAASDQSASFVAEAERRARAAAVNIRFVTCQWDDLPACFRDPFDLILCTGNSISHTLNRIAALRAFAAMRAVLKSGGTLLLDTRNWEKLRREKVRASVADHVVERHGLRCIPIYLWEYREHWDAQHKVEVLLIFEQDGRVSTRRYVLTYRPIRYIDLRACLEEARFAIHKSDYNDAADRYEIEAKKMVR
jgi:glycine/sarcosine N-methyltransferase